MKNWIKLFLIPFLYFFLIYALTEFIYVYLFKEVNLFDIFITSFIFALIVGLTFSIITVYRLNKNNINIKEFDVFKLSYKTEKYAEKDIEPLYEVLNCLFTKHKKVQKEKSIAIYTKTTFFSWGNIIELKMLENSKQNKCIISSKSKFRIQLFDFGENLINIRKIEAELE